MDYFLLSTMLGDPTLVDLDLMDVVLPPSCINPAVNFFCIGITFFKVGHSCALPLMGSLEHGQIDNPSFEPSPKVKLHGGEFAFLLGNVKAQDHQKGRAWG